MRNPHECDDEEPPEINEAEMSEIAVRIWRNIEIALLAERPEFLRALGWEIKLDQSD